VLRSAKNKVILADILPTWTETESVKYSIESNVLKNLCYILLTQFQFIFIFLLLYVI